MSEFRVIDGDGHVTESNDGLFEFVEGPRKGSISGTLVSPFPWLDGAHALTDPKRHVATDARRWRDFMDYCGIAEAVVFPTAGLACGLIMDPGWAATVSRAYNRWVHASHLAPEPRLHAVALLPHQDVSAAVEELRYAVTELGMVGGMLCSVTWDARPYGNSEFEPIYAEAQRLDVPIVFHGGSSYGLGLDKLRRPFEGQALWHPIPLLIHATTMIYSGIFERYPTLRVGFFEAGSTWVPYLSDRLDYFHHVLSESHDRPVPFAEQPSKTFSKGNIFVTCEAGERYLPMALEALGPKQLLYASDYPHEASWEEYPEDLKAIAGRSDVSEDVRRAILHDSAVRLYHLSEASGTAQPAVASCTIA